jgi:hypothetical protein
MNNEALFNQAISTLTIIAKHGATAQMIRALNDDYLEDLLKALREGTVPSRESFRKSIGLPALQFRLMPPRPSSLRELIAACAFDFVDSRLTPELVEVAVDDQNQHIIQIMEFGRTTDCDAVLSEMSKIGCRPGRIEDLLAFAIQFPNLAKGAPIVAFGSTFVSEGVHLSPYLEFGGSHRLLSLGRFDAIWAVCCRFIAICD